MSPHKHLYMYMNWNKKNPKSIKKIIRSIGHRTYADVMW